MSTVYAGRVRVADTGVIVSQPVKVYTNVVADIGKVLCADAGYGKIPSSALTTAKVVGVVREATVGLNGIPGDNTGGASGDVVATCEDGTYDFKNHGVHACSVADEHKTVYSSDGETMSNDSGDGPPAGTLVEFNPASAFPGRPCRVRLAVGPQAS